MASVVAAVGRHIFLPALTHPMEDPAYCLKIMFKDINVVQMSIIKIELIDMLNSLFKVEKKHKAAIIAAESVFEIDKINLMYAKTLVPR